MDLSFTEEMNDKGASFKDKSGNTINNLTNYLASRGTNLMRIRLWVNHVNGKYDLDYVKRQALIAQSNNMDFLLDFHFSDTWADPGDQETPAAWSTTDISALSTSLQQYCTLVMTELKNQGTTPQLVQIGNETNNGMLWPLGKVYNNGSEDWTNYVLLTKAAITGVKNVDTDAKIMIHYAGIDGAIYFFDQLENRNVSFDIAGLSYYPWWHGRDVNTIESDLQSLAQERSQQILIAETAYPFTLSWNDNTHNNVGLENQLALGYPATAIGQQQFLNKISQMVKDLPDNKGIGFCYWAPEWIAVDGATEGSSWENLALFDFDGKVNNSIEIFNED